MAGVVASGPWMPAVALAAETLAYETRIKGVPEDDLRDLLRRTSQLVARTDEPPATRAGLRRRARDDRDRLLRALRSEGFYDADIRIDVKEDKDPLRVVLRVTTGPSYLLAEADVVYTREVPADLDLPRDIADLDDLESGMQARAPRIVAAQADLVASLRNRGFPRARVENREAVVDHDTRTLNVTWRVDPGPRARFGRARLEGLASVDEAYVRQFITWQAGDIYDQREVAATRSNLQDTNLFAAVDVVRGEPRDGELPITLRLTEGEHRSLGFTARFSTSQGPSATAFWEHRNILGRHETLRTELDVGLITQELSGSFSKPRFLRENQSLDSDLSLRRQDSDAFNERSISGEVGLARDFENDISASLGGSAEMTVTEDNEGERTFALIGIPLSVTRSTRNSGLNPTSGSRISLDATPYAVTVDDTLGFMRNELNATTYYAVDEAERLILAARGRFGTILGQKTPDIPPSKRFFAGGGGSLRGFDFQSVGPLDDDNDPLGGRSVIEGSFEVRWRITETIGIVPFIDVGNVYDDPLPFLDQGDNEPFRVGAGLGARYHTPIGPLRVDVARALDQRDVDDAFELYISFGQAF